MPDPTGREAGKREKNPASGYVSKGTFFKVLCIFIVIFLYIYELKCFYIVTNTNIKKNDMPAVSSMLVVVEAANVGVPNNF